MYVRSFYDLFVSRCQKVAVLWSWANRKTISKGKASLVIMLRELIFNP
jgi:hypothetical protein